MPPFTLHWMSGSTPSRRVMLVLEEKGLPYTSKLLEMSKGDLKTPEYLALNPKGQVPTLQDGSRVVNESVGGMLYLDDLYPEKSLKPSDGDLRATMYQRLLEGALLFDIGKGAFDWKMRSLIKGPEDEEKYMAACKKLKTELDRWESYLSGEFLVGDHFTLADAACGPALSHLKRCGLDFSAYPKLKAYMETMEARPSFVATYPPHWKGSEDKDWLAPVTK